MIVDHRTYELQPGRLRDFLALYEKEGLPVQKKHLGNLVGYFTRSCISGATKISPIAPGVALRWLPTRHGRLTCRRAENS